MSKEIINLRDELRSHKLEFDLLQKVPCDKRENKEYKKILKELGKLPEGVYAYIDSSGETSTTEFYTIYETDLTDAEIREYLTYKQLSLIRTIKNCAVFFTALTVIGIVISILMALVLTGAL